MTGPPGLCGKPGPAGLPVSNIFDWFRKVTYDSKVHSMPNC